MSLTATDFPAASTLAVRAGIDCDTAHGAVTPPLVLSSNFSFTGLGGKRLLGMLEGEQLPRIC